MWDTKIAGCFGTDDRKFGREQEEEQRAFDLLSDLRAQGITWQQLSAAVRAHLAGRAHGDVANEMARVKRLMGPWVL